MFDLQNKLPGDGARKNSKKTKKKHARYFCFLIYIVKNGKIYRNNTVTINFLDSAIQKKI
jgi:hypothetical protein